MIVASLNLLFRIRPPSIILARKPLLFNGPDLREAYSAIVYVLKRLRDIRRLDRFKREIEAIRNLSHENILKLIDFDLDVDKPYLVSEYCAGKSLAEAEPFWSENATSGLKLFEQICNGVEHAHNHGIVHRDLKPENIFLRTNRGPAVVGDFGICYLESEDSRLTSIDRAVGPRLFMAPELEDGRDEAVSPRSDTYSLGKLLYWLLSGGRVFSREKHRSSEWDLKRRNEDSPVGWDNIYLEHVNRLLDVMIVHDRDKRRNVRTIVRLLPGVIRRVDRQYNPIGRDIGQPCSYCGYGEYVLQADTHTQVSNFGFNVVADPDWKIFTCSDCGHVQIFRVDMADKKE